MSWSFEYVGSKEQVKAKVQQEQHCPPDIIAVIYTMVDNLDAGDKLIHVKSNGHIDKTWASNASFDIRPILLLA